MNQTSPNSKDLVSVTVQVPRETAERLRGIAEANFRSLAAEVRRLMVEHIEETDAKKAA